MRRGYFRAAVVLLFVFGGVIVGRAQQPAGPVGIGPPLAPVSVEFAAAPLEEVTAALSKATGVPFAVGRSSPPAAFTVSAKERPFWDVFVELSKQNTLVYRPSMSGIELSAVGAPASLHVAGPMLLVAEVVKAEDWAGVAVARGRAFGRGPGRGPAVFVPGGAYVIPRYTGNGPGAELAPPEGVSFVVRLAAIADPRLMTTRTSLERVEVLDDTGKLMRVQDLRPAPMAPSATTGPWQARRTDYERLNFSAWRMAVTVTEGGGKAIGTVKGLVKLGASAGEISVKLDDVENKHVGEPFEIGSARFTLTRVSLRDNRYLSFQYGVEVQGAVGPGGAAAENPPLRVELQNAAGQPLIVDEVRRTMPQRNLTAVNEPRAPSAVPFTPPFNIVLRASERMEEREVAFEMKVGKGED